MALLTLDEAKTELGITVATYDLDLEDLILAVTECVDFLCGPSEEVAVTEVLHGCGALVLSTTPVVAVTSITGQYRGIVDVSSIFVLPTPGVVRTKTNYLPLFDDWYTVVYTAGRDLIPYAIKRGAKVILKHQWETRRGSGSTRPGSGGNDTTMVSGLSYAIPNRALQMMDRYLLGPSVG
jgi:hypothetical protein